MLREIKLFLFNKDENKDFILRSFLEGNSSNLKEFGLSAECVDYDKPIMTQIIHADVYL
jgi:hypothetical protein